jgi:hypothetical protein
MANWYPEWLALVPWVIGAALAAERLVHLTANRKAGRWLAFTFIVAAGAGLLTLSRQTAPHAAAVIGVATLICAVSGGAHLGILIVCEPSQSAAAE